MFPISIWGSLAHQSSPWRRDCKFSKQDCLLDLAMPSNADIRFNAKHNSVDWKPVIAWLESMTRPESRFLVTLTRLKSLSMTLVRVIFAKSQSPRSTNPVCWHTKKWSFFGPVMIKISANFLFWLSSRVILGLYPKGQVFITCTEVDLIFAFH